MNEEASKCSCVVDTSGLHAIAAASGNLQSILLDKLKSGVIGVPACVWQEFGELYEEEVAILAPNIGNKIIMKRSTYVGAARIAEQLNSGFLAAHTTTTQNSIPPRSRRTTVTGCSPHRTR
jgi:hypothetical protein